MLPLALLASTLLLTMRALVEVEPGQLELRDNVEKPTILDPTDLLVRVEAAALNPIDLSRQYMGSGVTDNEAYPVVVGYDMAGVVEEVGPGATTDFRVGDRVFGDVLRRSTGPKTAGTIAEFCVVSQDLVAGLPDSVSFEDGAALPVAAQTTLQALQGLDLNGKRVFVLGGTGGVGSHAVQIVRNGLGAAQVGTTASTSKVGKCQELLKDTDGDDDSLIVIDYTKDSPSEILPEWADVVLDCARQSDEGQTVLKENDGGNLISIADFGKPNVKTIQLTPSRDKMAIVRSMLESGKLKAVVDSVYPLDQAMEAVDRMKSGNAFGKIVIRIGDAGKGSVL